MEQCGLARPIGAEHHETLPGRHGEADPAQGGDSSIVLGDIVDGERDHRFCFRETWSL